MAKKLQKKKKRSRILCSRSDASFVTAPSPRVGAVLHSPYYSVALAQGVPMTMKWHSQTQIDWDAEVEPTELRGGDRLMTFD